MGSCNSKSQATQAVEPQSSTAPATKPTKQPEQQQQQPQVDNNNEARGLLEQGNNATREYRYQDALAAYSKCLELRENEARPNPEDLAVVNLHLGFCHEKLHHFEPALQAYTQSLKFRESVDKHGLEAAECYSRICRVEGRLKHLQPALDAGSKAIELRKQHFKNDEHPSVALAQMLVGDAYASVNKFHEARQIYEKALKIRERSLGAENAQIADSLLAIGNTYLSEEDYHQALEVLQRAHDLRCKQLGPDHQDVATTAVALAEVHIKLNQSTQAISVLEDAVRIREATFGSTNELLAETFVTIASVYILRKDFETASDHYKKALAIQEALFGEGIPVSNTLYLLAKLWMDVKRDNSSALPHIRRCLQIRQACLGPTHPSTLQAQLLMGTAAGADGDSDMALQFYQTIVDAYSKARSDGYTSPREHVNYADALQNMGRIFYDRGDPQRAVEVYEQAKEAYAKAKGRTSPEFASVAFNCGVAFTKLRNYKGARENFQIATDIRDKRKDDHNGLFAAATRLGETCEALFDLEGALKPYQIAAEARMDALGKTNNQPDEHLARALFNYGRAQKQTKDTAGALDTFQRVIPMLEGVPKDNTELIALIWSQIGEIHAEADHIDEAIQAFTKGTSIREKTHPTSDGVASAYYNLGILYSKKGDHEKAAECHAKSKNVRRATIPTAGVEAVWKPAMSEASELVNANQPAKAIPILEEVLSQQARLTDANSDTIATLVMLAGALADLKEYDKSTTYYKRAVAGLEIAQDRKALARAATNLGIVANSAGDQDLAIQSFQKAISVLETLEGRQETLAKVSNELGQLFQDKGDADKALEAFEKAAQNWKSLLGDRHESVGAVYYSMAETCDAANRFDDAAGWYFRAYDVWEKALGESNPNLAAVCFNLANAYSHAKDYETAASWYERSRDLFKTLYGPKDERTQRAEELMELMKWKKE